jgi:hypothetical protein
MKSDKFADQVYGINDAIQEKIETLDEIWDCFWPGAKRLLIGSGVVFAASLLGGVLFGWDDAIVRVTGPLSLLSCFFGYLGTSYVHHILRSCVGVMLGTGVAKKKQTSPA